MYNRFFGFKERPFKLVPNPAYLFLSRVHEEVLAHLNYAVGYGEGFVEITGEVGTGKTTLCRMFLENLDDNTEAAYVFNPKLDALQLLKAINDEFGIPTADTDSIKTLIDRLNAFLLDKKAQGKRVLVLVDEAQNLSPDVLEQLRLLSNLETTTSKLLQIILVGQPELGELLESDALRQLNQRITLSCHLTPLSYAETRDYIRHRIHIASKKPGLAFTAGACRRIHRYSGGVPRLINIACDRALLTAFTRNKHQITGRIVKHAIGELGGKRPSPRNASLRRERMVIGLLFALVLMVGGLVVLQVMRNRATVGVAPAVHHKIEKPAAASEAPAPAAETDAVPPAPAPMKTADVEQSAVERAQREVPPAADSAPAAPVPPDLAEILASLDAAASRLEALKVVLGRWDGALPEDTDQLRTAADETFFSVGARHNGLDVLRVVGNFNVVRKLNLPAILAFPGGVGGDTRYMAVVGLNDATVRLAGGPDAVSVPVQRLDDGWYGTAYILWKNYHNYHGIIPTSSTGEDIVALKVHLKSRGYPISEMTPAYDIATRSVVETIQARSGLQVDGKVGPQTKIAIYNEDRSLTMPRLVPVAGE